MKCVVVSKYLGKMVCVFHVRIGQSERNGEENVTKQLRKRSYRIG